MEEIDADADDVDDVNWDWFRMRRYRFDARPNEPYISVVLYRLYDLFDR